MLLLKFDECHLKDTYIFNITITTVSILTIVNKFQLNLLKMRELNQRRERASERETNDPVVSTGEQNVPLMDIGL